MLMKSPLRWALLFSAFACSPALALEQHPGAAVYAEHCAACHDAGENTQARSLETLRNMMPDLVRHALTAGRMKAQGDALAPEQREDVIRYLAGAVQGTDAWETEMLCADGVRRAATAGTPVVSSFGINHRNHRRLSAEAAGLRTADMSNLELAWVLAFPNVTMMRSQPAVVGQTMFVSPVESRKVYAFDISASPCLRWVYEADRVLRTSITFGALPDDRTVLVFGDMEAAVHMVDAQTGEGIWLTSLKQYPESIITGTPQLHGDRVYASISQFEIMVGAQKEHVCCKASGAVAALDVRDGGVIWRTDMLPKAQPVRDRGDGQMIWGPSGAPVWTTPAIDSTRGLLYIGTGEANSEPAHPHTDAVLALELETGAVAWSFQATANDIFLAGCWRQPSLNCPPEWSVNRDVDFGASIIIGKRRNGKDVLLAGQKSSTVWALDPHDEGQVLWRWQNGTGTANGGVHWAMAYDGDTVYVPLNDPGRPRPGFVPQPGLYALDVETGEERWRYRVQPDCEGREQLAPRCSYLYGLSAAPVVVDGAVVTGSIDGKLRIFDARNGALLFEYDTLRAFTSVNGVPGQGGAIDSASLAAANGLLLVNSGYGMFGQPQGNVLLAFRAAGMVNRPP